MKFRLTPISGSAFPVLVLALAAGCGGGKPQPIAPVMTPPALAPAVDMSPVAAPSTLMAWGRVSSPERMIGTAFGFVGLPAPSGEAIGELLEIKKVAAVADMSAPFEVAVFLGEGRSPKPLVLVSLPLRSAAEARQKLAQYKIQEERGVTTLALDDRGDDEEAPGTSASDKLCLITPAVAAIKGAPNAHRLVCGRKDTLDQYAAYMTRTLPTVASPAPLYGEFFMKPLRAPARELGRMANGLKLLFDNPELAGLVELAIQATGDALDFTQDLDTAFVTGDITDAGARATVGLRFGSNKSSLSTFLVQHPERAFAALVGLDSTPSDAALAAFSHGIDLAPFDKALGMLHDQLMELAKSEKFPAAERAQLDELLTRTKAYMNHAAVSSRGFDDVAVDKALSAYAPNKTQQPVSQKLRFAASDALDGWHAYRSDVSQDELVKLSAAWGKLLGSPAIKKWISTQVGKPDAAGKEADASGVLSAMRPKDVERFLDVLTIKVKTSKAAASYGLPKGTELVEFSVPRFAALAHPLDGPPPPASGKKRVAQSKPEPKPAPAVYKMFVTTDSGAALSVYSTDTKLAVAKLKESLAKSGAQSAPVQKLAAMKANGGGFITLRAGAAMHLDTLLQEGSVSERNLARFRNASKDDGVLFSWRSLAPTASSAGGSLEFELEVPSKTVLSAIKLAR